MILNAVDRGKASGGAPVVLLHGLFGSAQNFGTVQRHLAQHGRVIALDLRDHGASPHGRIHSYADLASDVIETLAALDALPCALVGHSMGGKVAMQAALDRPDAVARLAVCDIAPVPYGDHFRALAAAMQAMALAPGLTREAADAALAPHADSPALRAFLLRNLLPGTASGDAPSWRIGLDEIAAGLPVIEDWQPAPGAAYAGPCLFVAGDRSDYILAEHRPAIRALFPQARFAVVKNAGHWLHADNPDGFLAVIGSFLR